MQFKLNSSKLKYLRFWETNHIFFCSLNLIREWSWPTNLLLRKFFIIWLQRTYIRLLGSHHSKMLLALCLKVKLWMYIFCGAELRLSSLPCGGGGYGLTVSSPFTARPSRPPSASLPVFKKFLSAHLPSLCGLLFT